MNSQKKIHIRSDNRVQKKTPELQLIPGGKQDPNRRNGKTIFRAILILVAVSLLLTYASLNKTKDPHFSIDAFATLHDVLTREGMNRYLQEKEELRKVVKQVLEAPTSEEQRAYAQNIAVYLFPDVLQSDDFEKEPATEQWMTLEHAIEDAPRTPESRALFTDLRAGIWNYENPDRSNPQLSSVAKEVIRIFETLSAP